MENQADQATDQTTQTTQAPQTIEAPTEKATRTRAPRPRCFICANGDVLEVVFAETKDLACAAFETKHGFAPAKTLEGEGVGFYVAKNYNKTESTEVRTSDFVKAKDISNMDDLQTLAECVISYKGWKINSFEMGQNNTSEKYYFIRNAPEKIEESAPRFDFKGPLYIKENADIKIENRNPLSF